MITSTIKFSQIEDRIDAEYYKPEFLEIEKLLSNGGLLKQVVDISAIKKDPTKLPDKKFNYLEIDNVDLQTGDVQPQEILGSMAPSRARKGVQVGDSILSTVRPNRNAVGFITDDLKDCICSTGFSVIHPKDVLPGYLFVFLKSKLAINQLIRLTTAAMYPAVSEADISNLKIPVFPKSFQEKIEKIFQLAYRKRKEANKSYKEAEEILNKELGVKNLDLSIKRTFETKFSETNERIDPEYYQPFFNEVEKIFKKQKTVNLGDISLEIKYGTSEDLFYVEKGMPFLRVTDINKFSTIEPMEGKFINNFDAERLKKYQVKTDDIIISRTGTLGLAVYIDEKLDGAIYGSYFIKVSPRHKDLYNRFIAFFISSEIGRLQTNRWASGGIQTNLTIDAIKSIRIPILFRPIQQRICSLIQDSLKLREETGNLLNEAKQKVEKMVLGE